MQSKVATEKKICRGCGNTQLVPYLDFGLMPLSNNLENTAQSGLDANRYPLCVNFCEKCAMSQLSHVIDPDVMFSYYTYRSSINEGYKKHCRDMAIELKKDHKLNGKSFVIDIAGNDGALLREFQNVTNCRSLNVDPARNLCAIAESSGVKSLPVFWNFWNAKEILFHHGEADVITATNVFAHVDDVSDFLRGVKLVLKRDGIFVLEFPYLEDLIDRNEFDTVYFEHLSYLGIHPVNYLCEKAGLKICSIDKFSIHGGTVRVKIVHDDYDVEIKKSVIKYLINEKKRGYNSIDAYLNWSDLVKTVIEDFSVKIQDLKKNGYKIAAFAASAKGNTLLNSANIDNTTILYIADETPEKIGKFSPGTGIPIVHMDMIRDNVPDYIVILSWNFKQEIIEKLRNFYDGKFIIPIPKFEII